MASDQEWLEQYAKGGQQQPQTCTSCGQPMPPKQEQQPSKFYQQRRTEDSGNYPRPRLGGMTVR
jgi:hypothetical protein